MKNSILALLAVMLSFSQAWPQARKAMFSCRQN